MQRRTLGGDRLGAGQKEKVDMHGFERSTHDLGYLWRSTMSAGTLVPFMSQIAVTGDTWDINLNCDVKTHPTIGPLFGSYKVQLDIFQAPVRLYNSALHNNMLGVGNNMSQVKLPQITLIAPYVPGGVPFTDIDNSQINPSCILSYLGIRGIGQNRTEEAGESRNFNAIPLLAYWEIYKNYYANKQEEEGCVIHTPVAAIVQTITTASICLVDNTSCTTVPSTAGSGVALNQTRGLIKLAYTGSVPIPEQVVLVTQTGEYTFADLITHYVDTGAVLLGYYDWARHGNQIVTHYKYRTDVDTLVGEPSVYRFPLSNIDQRRETILATGPLAQYNLATDDIEPYSFLHVIPASGIPNLLQTQEGLAVKTYQSDLFNNWLKTEWIDGAGGITEVTAIDTSGGSFTLDTLNLSKKVYDMLNRIAVSGGSYDDWLDAVYAHDRYQRCESPMYMGGLIKELVFQEVVSNSQSEGDAGEQPLGTLAGKGVMAKKHKGGSVVVKVDEPSYIMGIISLTPRIDYSQGNKWDIHLQTMDDFHKPALDEIGFQELITEQMAWWDTVYDPGTLSWIQKSAGKQPAWLNYMTNVNQTRGNFAINTNEMFMTLNRRYSPNNTYDEITDLTTYIDPSKFNFIFAQTALDSQNFWAQIGVDITARRKMSAKVMPNL